MDIKIKLGTPKDIESLTKLYDEIHNHLKSTINYPGWIKGIYPIRQDAEDGINEGCLFVATENNKTIASIILNHKPESAYLSAAWQAELDYSNILVLHTFIVSPQKLRHGIGRKMLEFAEQYANDTGVKALRLDVYENNLPAVGLYEKCGYRYIDTVSLGLEDVGLNRFRLYEKLV